MKIAKPDAFDRFLRNATFGVALVRVLRGESPARVLADVKSISEKADKLRESVEQHAGAPSSTEREPSDA